jgi:hypothetical protein
MPSIISGVADNQMVTEAAAAATTAFALNSGQTRVSSNILMTKLDAITRYNLAANFGSYANNQLIPATLWASGVPLDCTLVITAATSPYYTAILGSDGGGGGGGHLTWTTRYITGGSQTYPTVGSIVYLDSALTTVFNGQSFYWDDYSSRDYYFVDIPSGRRFGNTSYRINSSGVIIEVVTNLY